MGLAYAKGDMLPQDEEKALMWFEKAAAQGLSKAKRAINLLKNGKNLDYL